MNIWQGNAFLNSLLSDATRGALLPAAFQRPYVWSQQDVLALCESILRGYPIGSFLQWTPWGKADLSKVARVRLGPVPASDGSLRTALLLDGQNRLASLAWLANDWTQPLPDDLSEGERLVWANGERLVANLETQKLEFVPEAQAEEGFRLPSRAIVDSKTTSQLCRRLWNTAWSGYSDEFRDKGLQWFDDVQHAFRDARVVVTDLQNATAAEAKDAFLHICKVGVPMSVEDLEKSLAWGLPA